MKKSFIYVGIFVGMLMISLVSAGLFTGNAVWGGSWCTKLKPCPVGEGDCDGPSSKQKIGEDGTRWRESNQCQTGWCHLDVGKNYGQGRLIDVCECLEGLWDSEEKKCVERINIEATCTDSDGGKDYDVRSLVTSTADDSSQWDHCVNSESDTEERNSAKYLFEGFCNSQGWPNWELYECPDGCVEGQCVHVEETNVKEGGEGGTEEVTYQGVLEMLQNNQKAYDISLGDSGWDIDGDGYITGREVCKHEGRICISVLSEYRETTPLGLEPSTCNEQHGVDTIGPAILNVWCCSAP